MRAGPCCWRREITRPPRSGSAPTRPSRRMPTRPIWTPPANTTECRSLRPTWSTRRAPELSLSGSTRSRPAPDRRPHFEHRLEPVLLPSGIADDATLAHLVEKRRDVIRDGLAIGVGPGPRELVDDRLDRVRAVAQLENLRGRVAQREAALGIEQEVPVFAPVPLESSLWGEPRPAHEG